MKNDIVRAKCIDMSVDGQGIAKANDLVIFVKGMIVGEEADVKIIAYEGEEGPSTSFCKCVESIKPKQKIAILIGPEGGFSANEVDFTSRLGYKKVSLGKRILRAETATFYTLSVIANFLERK